MADQHVTEICVNSDNVAEPCFFDIFKFVVSMNRVRSLTIFVFISEAALLRQAVLQTQILNIQLEAASVPIFGRLDFPKIGPFS